MNEHLPSDDDLWSLCEALCSGTLDENQLVRLEERLKADPKSQELFAQYCLLNSDLRFFVSANAAVDAARKQIDLLESDLSAESASEIAVPQAPPRFPQISFPLWGTDRSEIGFWRLGGGLVIAVLILLAVLFRFGDRSSPSPRNAESAASNVDVPSEYVGWNRSAPYRSVQIEGFVGQVIDASDSEWEGQASALMEREYLCAGQVLRLRRGSVEVKLFGGGRLILEGPAELIIDSKDGGTLVRGRVIASADERVCGLHIKTADALVVDLGAKFGVNINQVGDTEIHAVDGALQVALLRSGQMDSKAVRRLVNQSLTIEKKTGTVMLGASNPDLFVRSTPNNSQLNMLMRESLVTHFSFDDPHTLGLNRGNGHNGVSSEGVTATHGLAGGGADFGDDDLRSIEVDRSDVEAISPGGSSGHGLTVCAWVKTTCIDKRCNVFFAYNSPEDNSNTVRDILLLELEFGGLPNAFVREKLLGQEISLTHHQGIADGRWHHVALTLSPGKEKTLGLYVDGELSRTHTSYDVNSVILQRARIGRRLCEKVSEDNDFQGSIDELMIFNRALKPSEIRLLYNSSMPVSI